MTKRGSSGTIDFAKPDLLAGSLSASDVSDLLTVAGDIALVLSPDGIIEDVASSQPDLSGHGLGDWTGSAWADVVTIESRGKVREMLAEAQAADAAPRSTRAASLPAATLW